jgi:Tfp pilus assembly protein PilF
MQIQKKEYELAKNGLIKTIKMDDKDPEGYYYLAEIYAMQGKNIQAIKNISQAISVLENKKLNYYISDLNDEAIPISQVYYKLGTLYEILKEKELVCEYYQKALVAIENEMRPDKIEFKKRLKEQIDIYCTE